MFIRPSAEAARFPEPSAELAEVAVIEKDERKAKMSERLIDRHVR